MNVADRFRRLRPRTASAPSTPGPHAPVSLLDGDRPDEVLGG
jgi:hypothetical protein